MFPSTETSSHPVPAGQTQPHSNLPVFVDRHTPVARNDRPFQCRRCRKLFSRKDVMQRHLARMACRILAPSSNRSSWVGVLETPVAENVDYQSRGAERSLNSSRRDTMPATAGSADGIRDFDRLRSDERGEQFVMRLPPLMPVSNSEQAHQFLDATHRQFLVTNHPKTSVGSLNASGHSYTEEVSTVDRFLGLRISNTSEAPPEKAPLILPITRRSSLPLFLEPPALLEPPTPNFSFAP
ncbi:hypothetical protein M427DRAFT_323344 [Gonapodya prolifera JEL478]|uniref:C2H2-type domain-containing protein n=1 Tax=Gonapodya prolifera (strain JEL478) TaxID=1344416 RepID=A0A139AFS6_GONPJ|nr:hypothetical protein M427DRAFT_323344 [Gonapodya prolifera JEL478]|eukprot:KXS15610.1 hypothetical protein M427DRAFT_323344 [Gonapodya prolifera JEL478]